MKQGPFEAAHAVEWREFEAFTESSGKRKGEPPFDLAEMPERYRRLCQSLALAADRQYSPDLVDRLNHLALRGHHALYAERGRDSRQIVDFLTGGFPALVRREWRLVLVAALLFFGPLLGLIAVLQVWPEFVHYLLAPDQIAAVHQMYDPANHRLGMRDGDSNVLMFAFYIWNNVRIGFQTFAGGLLFGVGSLWFLGSNGMVIGAISGYLTQIGYHSTFWFGLYAPAGTPAAVVARLHEAALRGLSKPEAKARMAAGGMDAAPSASPEAFDAEIRAEGPLLTRIIRESGAKIE